MAKVFPADGTRGDSEEKPLWKRVLWCVLFPAILVWHSIAIYFLPCIAVYIERVLAPCLLGIGRTVFCCCFCKCWKRKQMCYLCDFEDGSFPPDATSLGNWHNLSPSELATKIEWKRAADVSGDGNAKAKLFTGGTTPQDLVQGQLGDCWLLAALACLTERPGAVERCFVTRQRNSRGMYVLRLFDGKRKQWERVVVDDFIPTEGGRPIFAKPNSNEMWVLILEKAVAKFLGDYQALDGGLVTWAFELMTGDNVHHFGNENGMWEKCEMRHSRDEKNRKRVGYYKVQPAELYDDEAMYGIMKEYLRIGSVLGASSTQGRSDQASDSREGICQGHAYSVIDAVQAHPLLLLKLRNPWGAFEWKGDWSDASPLWQQNPSVARSCGHEAGAKDDGVFWMEMKDFRRHFDQVDVCHRSTGLADLQLDVREEEGCAGPCKGCVLGCCAYWCLCRGCAALCCASESSSETVKQGGGCCGCF